METMRQDNDILSHQFWDGRDKDRETGAGAGERERETNTETGENEKKLQKQKNSWNFILSYFTPQNGVKHDSGL